jgi:hypothetical protein
VNPHPWYRLLLIAGAIACGSATTAPNASSVAGVWTYSGTQDVPVSATLNGQTSWSGVVGGPDSFEGTCSIVEYASSGEGHLLTGTIGGQVLADSIADFDLSLAGSQRRHLGVVRGDSIAGSWSTIGTGTVASGRFVLRRQATAR